MLAPNLPAYRRAHGKPGARTRVRCAAGWVSLSTGDGERLLELIEPAEAEAALCAEATSLQEEMAVLQGRASASGNPLEAAEAAEIGAVLEAMHQRGQALSPQLAQAAADAGDRRTSRASRTTSSTFTQVAGVVSAL